MGLGAAVKSVWGLVRGVEAAEAERKTSAAPSNLVPFLTPSVGPGGVRMAVVPKRTAANLRRFAETPVA